MPDRTPERHADPGPDGQSGRRGRPPNDPGRTRERLLLAAAEVFNSDGYFATDTNRIARAAGFAPATFYRLFRDKKDIFLQAYTHWVDADWQSIEAVLAQSGSPRELAGAVTLAHAAHHQTWVQFRRSMQALVAIDEEARAFHLAARSRQLERLEDQLRAAGAPGRPRGELLYRFLAIERVANAVSEGDPEALGISRDEVMGCIEDAIAELLGG